MLVVRLIPSFVFEQFRLGPAIREQWAAGAWSLRGHESNAD